MQASVRNWKVDHGKPEDWEDFEASQAKRIPLAHAGAVGGIQGLDWRLGRRGVSGEENRKRRRKSTSGYRYLLETIIENLLPEEEHNFLRVQKSNEIMLSKHQQARGLQPVNRDRESTWAWWHHLVKHGPNRGIDPSEKGRIDFGRSDPALRGRSDPILAGSMAAPNKRLHPKTSLSHFLDNRHGHQLHNPHLLDLGDRPLT